jgi:hypothetical protein
MSLHTTLTLVNRRDLRALLTALEDARDSMVKADITPGPELYNAISTALGYETEGITT